MQTAVRQHRKKEEDTMVATEGRKGKARDHRKVTENEKL